MTEAALPARALHRPRQVARLAVGRRVGSERLALGATAIAVAMLPLAVPAGPANTAPNDLFIATAVVACLLWATGVRFRWRFPYVLPVALALVGGAIGGLVGSVPSAGIIALIQDMVLIAWCWTVANISHRAANLRILLTTWVYSGIGWAIMAFVGLATGSSLLTGPEYRSPWPTRVMRRTTSSSR